MQFLRKIFKLGPIESENSAWPKIDVKKLSHGQPRGVIDDGAPSIYKYNRHRLIACVAPRSPISSSNGWWSKGWWTRVARQAFMSDVVRPTLLCAHSKPEAIFKSRAREGARARPTSTTPIAAAPLRNNRQKLNC